MSNAKLMAHCGTNVITRKELDTIPTPAPTKTWQPVRHALVPNIIEQFVDEYGWQFKENGEDRFKIAVSPDRQRMFGVTAIQIPDVDEVEYGLALGFRNSHNKTMALKLALGTDVFVCDNMAMTGDIQFSRIHYSSIDPFQVVRDAFERIPAAAKSIQGWFNHLQETRLDKEDGVYLIAEAVEAKALPLGGFMGARAMFLEAYKSDSPTIQHGGTVWSAYQAITAQYKKVHLDQNPVYSKNLTKLITTRFDGKLLPATIEAN